MSCFDNIIAIKELCSEIEPQTFYLNDIGINAKEVQSYLTGEYSGIQNFIDEKSAFAIRLVQGDIYSHLSPQYKASSILASNRVGQEANIKTLVSQSGFVGVEIKMYNPISFVDFTLSDISLFTDYTGNVPVFVYDLLQGKLLGTLTVPSVAGEISSSFETITISAPRKQLHLWIGYDSTGINSYKTTTTGGCTSCSGFTFSNRFIRATGASAESPFTASTIESETHTAGISFNYSVVCNHYDWLCVHRHVLGLPFLYRTGIEIIKHAKLASINQRTMTTTTVNKAVLDEKLDFYTAEYNNTLNNILRNMRTPSDINCFHCNMQVQTITSLPS